MENIDDDDESFLERLSKEKIQDTKAQRTITKAIIKISGNQRNIQELVESKLKRYNDTSDLRKHSAYWVMVVVSFWLILVVSIVFFCGFECMKLEPSVIIALLTTTTVNIIGLPLVLLQGLYPKEKEMEMIDNEIEKLKEQDKDNYL